MPVVIEEVIANVQESVTQPTEARPAAQQQPLNQTEAELAASLDRVWQRQQRLLVD